MPTKAAPHIPEFRCSEEDKELIHKIVARARAMALAYKVQYPVCDIDMDLTACHCNGCPLDLTKLLNAPDGTFGHDIFGIRRFINRITGKMPDAFQPRCAK